MTKVYMSAFCLGVKEELSKHARCWAGYEPVPGKKPYSEDSCRPVGEKKKEKKKQPHTKEAFDVNSMPLNENILPNISSQAKWKYVRTKDGLKLTDGNLVYSFGNFPEEYPAEDARVLRMADDNILNFDKDAISKGTAQIHRSSPDNLYLTLATGGDNPTFMLQHEEGKNWRYSPSKKFLEKLKAIKRIQQIEEAEKLSAPPAEEPALRLDSAALFDGMQDSVKKAFDLAAGEGIFHGSEDLANSVNSLISGAGNLGRSFVESRAAHPFTSILEGYVGSKILNRMRDIADPEYAHQRLVNPKARTDRELLPLVTATAPVAISGAIMA
jgi:hypothetical protein